MRWRAPLTLRIGLALILLGVAGRATIQHWMSTRIVYPLDIPVSLATGHIRSGPFLVNLDTTYEVVLNMGADQIWEAKHPECDPYRHLQTRWVLYQNGKIVDRLDEPVVLPWPSFFSASPGVYELDVEVLSDFRCLDPIHPRLEVIAITENYETGAFLLKAAAAGCIFVGAILLTFVPLIRFVQRPRQPVSFMDAGTSGQSFQWAQKLPLHRPISGLPSFGLFAGIFFALIASVMMFTDNPAIPKELRVYLLKPGAAPEKIDQLEPLIVYLKDQGLGQQPKLYLNSVAVSWDDFPHLMKQELSRRREWIVYVRGDECIAWTNIAAVIDIARELQAKVFLLTDQKEEPCALPRVRPVTM